MDRVALQLELECTASIDSDTLKNMAINIKDHIVEELRCEVDGFKSIISINIRGFKENGELIPLH